VTLPRRGFLRRFGIASSALTISPVLFGPRSPCLAGPPADAGSGFTNSKPAIASKTSAKLWDMLGGVERYIGPNDVVVIKGNAQWPNQGYTHTGCIKAVIDRILATPISPARLSSSATHHQRRRGGRLGF